jgi:hypothetical protein
MVSSPLFVVRDENCGLMVWPAVSARLCQSDGPDDRSELLPEACQKKLDWVQLAEKAMKKSWQGDPNRSLCCYEHNKV